MLESFKGVLCWAVPERRLGRSQRSFPFEVPQSVIFSVAEGSVGPFAASLQLERLLCQIFAAQWTLTCMVERHPEHMPYLASHLLERMAQLLAMHALLKLEFIYILSAYAYIDIFTCISLSGCVHANMCVDIGHYYETSTSLIIFVIIISTVVIVIAIVIVVYVFIYIGRVKTYSIMYTHIYPEIWRLTAGRIDR